VLIEATRGSRKSHQERRPGPAAAPANTAAADPAADHADPAATPADPADPAAMLAAAPADCVHCGKPTEYPESTRGMTLCPVCEWQEAQRTACSG
jgi:hypothetical protein